MATKKSTRANSRKSNQVVFSGNFNDLKEMFPNFNYHITTAPARRDILTKIDFIPKRNHELLTCAISNSGEIIKLKFKVVNSYNIGDILIKSGIYEFE